MGVDAVLLLESVHPEKNVPGRHLLTWILRCHRFVLAEFNTHRGLCLTGDTEIEFDLPGGDTDGHRRVHRMALADFVDKWHDGARRTGFNPRKLKDLSLINDNEVYSTKALGALAGYTNATSLNLACRQGDLEAVKGQDGRTWLVTGRAFKSWWERSPEYTRFTMRRKLMSMRIRQLDEQTGKIVTSTVADCIRSGEKAVFDVRAGNFVVSGSQDHLVMTASGYVRIGDLLPGTSQLVVRRFGKTPEDRVDPTRLKKIDGVWRSVIQRHVREERCADGCQYCGSLIDLHIHHQIPVHKDPSHALNQDNMIVLCKTCHQEAHRTQDWQGGTYLYGDLVTVDSVEFRGVEPTYDLEIAGPYPNFVANGVVVHNSRNSASSRAVPFPKMLERVLTDPAIPLSFPAERKGMQGGAELSEDERATAIDAWLRARDAAVEQATRLHDLGVHKSVANRLLEPFMWHEIVATGDDAAWDHFFALRANPLAQPEIRALAERMLEIYASPARHEASVIRQPGEWHLPFVENHDLDEILGMTGIGDPLHAAKACSVARCARVSYLTHDSKTRDVDKDLALFARLVNPGDGPPHASPMEHVATPAAFSVVAANEVLGNFASFHQFRHDIEAQQGVRYYR